MPPKRASKRRASKSSTPEVAAKQRRSEGQSASLLESTTLTPQFSPTFLGEIISNAISGALQSAGIDTLNISPAVGEQRISNQSMSQPTVVEDAASKEIAELTNTVAPGRLTFASEKPDDTFSSVTFDLESRVSDRLKTKIWANEYVDFGSLSPLHRRSPNIDYLSLIARISLVFALSTLSPNAVACPLING